MLTPLLTMDDARGRFPGLRSDWAFFDHAGGSPPLGAVIEAAGAHQAAGSVQLGASYGPSVEAQARVDAGRSAAARLVAGRPEDVALGPSTTANVLRLTRALAPGLEEGDEIIVTNLDHEANLGPWRRLEREGVRIREWRASPRSHELHLEDLEPLLGPRTRVVAFTHVSNLVGSIHDVPAICTRIREHGAMSVVDGVAFAPHRRVDVEALGCDAYLLSLYKVYGPHLGLLWVHPDRRAELDSLNHHFIAETTLAAKLEPGGLQHEAVASLPPILDYLEELGGSSADASLERAFTRVADREAELVAPLLEFLASWDRVHILGRASANPKLRVPTVSFTVDGLRSSEIPILVDEHRVAIRYGHFYAHQFVRDLGLLDRDGVVRASLLHLNTPEEVDRLIAALADALSSLGVEGPAARPRP